MLAVLPSQISRAHSQPSDQPSSAQEAHSKPKSESTEPSIWEDPATKLTWAAPADDEKVTWDEARKYCKELKAAGHHWRLPAIDELAAIYDASQSIPCGATKGAAPDPCHIKEGIKLTEWQAWSSTHDPKHSGWAYYFNFIDGQRRALPHLNAYGLQALCVAK
jgi:hypothetical protein